MGRGYITAAVRRAMGYPMKGYIRVGDRKPMSAMQNKLNMQNSLNVYSNNVSQELKNYFNENFKKEFKDSLIKAIDEELKLNLNDEKDMQVFADAMRLFNFKEKPDFARGLNSIQFNGSYQNQIHNNTKIIINKDNIEIKNNSFSTEEKTPNGIRYAMLARQLAAAKEIAKRTEKPVNIIDVYRSKFNMTSFAEALAYFENQSIK